MGQYYRAYNIDKKEAVDPFEYKGGAKLLESCYVGNAFNSVICTLLGEWEDYPNFVDCTVFGNRADALNKFLRKGMKVAIEGKLRWSQWERDGQKRSKIEVIVDEVEVMVSKQSNGGEAATAPAVGPMTGVIYDDDIPF